MACIEEVPNSMWRKKTPEVIAPCSKTISIRSFEIRESVKASSIFARQTPFDTRGRI